MFGTRRVLEEMSGTRRVLEGISETLSRMDARMDSEFKTTRSAIEKNSSAIENNIRVTREILLELQHHRPILQRIEDGVQSNSAVLMHVLDELRDGRGGPGSAPAA